MLHKLSEPSPFAEAIVNATTYLDILEICAFQHLEEEVDIFALTVLPITVILFLMHSTRGSLVGGLDGEDYLLAAEVL